MMETHFAPALRASDATLATEIKTITNNPVMSGLLNSVSGLLIVLDKHRQIVAVNHSFMEMLGIDQPQAILGLRPGEAVNCVHAEEMPGGCGTSQYCDSCGAAIAIVASLEHNQPTERLCALETAHNGTTTNRALMVKSQPITLGEDKFLLLFLQDITQQEQWAALERTFFHDINNLLGMLAGAGDLLVGHDDPIIVETIQKISQRLINEVSIQRALSQKRQYEYSPQWHAYPASQIINELLSFFKNHPAAKNKNIILSSEPPEVTLKTDFSLIQRVLSNMVINALEATCEDGIIKISTTQKNQNITFSIWNSQGIPAAAKNRIFQRNFSTKGQSGRGIGTFSMKLFGEQILGGKVNFTSSKVTGTTFSLSLPL